MEQGESIAAWIDIPSSLVTVKAAQHRIVRLGLIGSDDE